MIRYDLVCDNGHAFDGWFSGSAAYDAQAAQGLVNCSVCGSVSVEKQVMAPRIPAKSNARALAPRPMMAGPVDLKTRIMLEMMREMRKSVAENAEYVGPRFAEVARQMHYEETEKRGIYGEATQDDAKALIEEGIEVHPLPVLPEDGN